MTKASPKRVAKKRAAKTNGSNSATKTAAPAKSTVLDTIKLNEQEVMRIRAPRQKIEQINMAMGRNRAQQKKLQGAEDDMFRQLLIAEQEFDAACRAVSESHGVDPDHPTESWNLDLGTMVMSKNNPRP